MKYLKINCPSKRPHRKKSSSGSDLIVEPNCGALLSFVGLDRDTKVIEIYYCRNCKKLIKAEIDEKNQKYEMTILPKETRLEEVQRSFIVNEH